MRRGPWAVPLADNVHFSGVAGFREDVLPRADGVVQSPPDRRAAHGYLSAQAARERGERSGDRAGFPVLSDAARGVYNYSTDIENTLTPNRNWGGVMKPLSVSAINLSKENINFIELWMRVDRAPPNAKMLIDLGAISEDVIPNRNLNSEDLVISSYPNGVLQEGEDVGIDMLSDGQEAHALRCHDREVSGDGRRSQR